MKNIVSMLFAVMAAGMFSCTTTEDIIPENEMEELTLLNEKQIPGTELTMKIYQHEEKLMVGYNRFEVMLKKAGVEGDFTNAAISFNPMMDMGTMMHACPKENPVMGTNFENAFAGAVTFVMPSGDMGNWTLGVMVKDNDTGDEGEATIPVTVEMPKESRVKSFSMGDDTYFVTMVEPYDPEVGANDFEVTINKKESMMNWPVVDIFQISMDPEMPDMGHGSPNNVDPVITSNGHYMGKVNFTMDGYWKINLQLKSGEMVQDLSFDVTFENRSTK